MGSRDEHWRSLSSGENSVASSIEEFLVPKSPAGIGAAPGGSVRQPIALEPALSHIARSFNENNNAMEDNERLEFLGDAVLDFVVGASVTIGVRRWPRAIARGCGHGAVQRARLARVRGNSIWARVVPDGTAARLLLAAAAAMGCWDPGR